MKLYLIRHGKTAGNLEGRYVGRTDEPLCGAGTEALKELLPFYASVRPDILFVSPMLRCIQTAGLLFPAMEQTEEPDFAECDFGEFEYKTWRELSGNGQYQKWIDSGGALPFPGGESRDAFTKRCAGAFRRALSMASGQACQTAAFVVHGGTIMSIMETFARPRKDYFDYQVKNGCGYLAVWDEGLPGIVLQIAAVLPKACGGKERL